MRTVIQQKSDPFAAMKRHGAVLAVLIAATTLQSCARDPQTTGSVALDYRQRHPITLSEAQHSFDIPISSGDSRLTTAMVDNVHGFAQSYSNASTGIIQIHIPTGSANSSAASFIKKQVREALTKSGIAPSKIVEIPYRANSLDDAAPIRLSYVSMTAMTSQCGEWPEDMNDHSRYNENWYNFGCASQNNLAAQLANPLDLMGPRAMTPVDAAQRSRVISTYRAGTETR